MNDEMMRVQLKYQEVFTRTLSRFKSMNLENRNFVLAAIANVVDHPDVDKDMVGLALIGAYDITAVIAAQELDAAKTAKKKR